jgi:hypothetical protein
MAIKKILVTVVLSGLVGACGSVASNLPSMDQNATTITASCATDNLATVAQDGGRGKYAPAIYAQDGGRGRFSPAVYAQDGGRGRYGFAASALQCNTYVVQVSGTCENCQSVLVEAADKTVSVTVNQDGTFNYSFETTTITNIDLTPLSF